MANDVPRTSTGRGADVPAAALVLAPYLLFLASGASGLVYQVLWVRQFGGVFGNTVHSAALVTAAFMCGLGVGGYLAGAWADRRFLAAEAAGEAPGGRFLAAYGTAEIAIGAMGAGLAVALPRLDGLSTRISAYAPGAGGFLELSFGSMIFRYAAAVVLLAPITVLMGGTLTLLIRHVVAARLDRAGTRIGALYGLNTLGAAIGCVATDFALVPALGLLRTQLVAASINLAVGLAALALARRSPASAVLAAPTTAATRAPALADPARHALWLTAIAIGLTGFTGMGLEIVWFRVLGNALGAYRAVFSLLLAVLLVSMWAGSMIGGAIHRRFPDAATSYIVVETLLVLVALALLATFQRSVVDQELLAPVRALGASAAGPSAAGQVGAMVRTIAGLVGPPALLMGFAFPLANAHVQRAEASVGRRAGALYLANTAGSVLGSIVAGFALLPQLGAQASVFWLALAAASAVVPLGLARRRLSSRRAVGAADVIVATAALALFVGLASYRSLLPDDDLRRRVLAKFPGERLLDVTEGENEVVAVTVDPLGDRRLCTNGHSMSGNSPEAQRYMRAFAHVPLLLTESPRSVLVICFGVGNTLHAASLHPSVERLELADLSRNVLDHAPFFEATNHGVLRDPRVRVFVDDGRQHLRMAPPGTYDLVTLEPPPIAFAGVSALYAREFYELAKSRLAPGGLVTQWLPFYQLRGPEVLALVRAFVDVFPDATLLSGERRELILLGAASGAVTVDPSALARRLAARPAVRADLARVDLARPSELVGMFAADGAALRAATASTAPVTDDWPITEYSTVSNVFATRAPAELFDVRGAATWCPACFGATPLPDLAAHLRVTGALYASEAFRSFRNYRAGDSTVDPADLFSGDDGSIAGAVTRSGYLTSLVGLDPFAPEALTPPRLAALAALVTERPGIAVLELRLGLALVALERLDAAVPHLRRAVAIDPALAGAHFALATVVGRTDPAEAASLYAAGLALDPAALPARVARFETLIVLGRADDATAEAERILSVDPGNGPVHHARCLAGLRRRAPAVARASCARAYEAGVPMAPEVVAVATGEGAAP